MELIKYISLPIILSALGALLVLLGTFLASVNKSKTDTIIHQKNEEMILMQKELQEKTDEISKLTVKVSEQVQATAIAIEKIQEGGKTIYRVPASNLVRMSLLPNP